MPMVTPRTINNVPRVMMNDGRSVRSTRYPLKTPSSEGECERREHRQPDVPAELDAEQRENDAARADRRADRQIELAADHQQRHGDGEDAELGGHFEVVRRPAPGQEAATASGDREEDPDADRPGDGAHLRAHQQRGAGGWSLPPARRLRAPGDTSAALRHLHGASPTGAIGSGPSAAGSTIAFPPRQGR